MVRNINTTRPATANPLRPESGRLIQGLLVFSIFENTMPKPPNAVMKEAMAVGLSKEKPGMS